MADGINAGTLFLFCWVLEFNALMRICLGSGCIPSGNHEFRETPASWHHTRLCGRRLERGWFADGLH